MARVKIGNVRQPIKELLKYLSPAVLKTTIPSNGAVSFFFNAGTNNALISCRTTKKDGFALFLYSGYSNGGIRSNISVLCGMDSNITYGIMEATPDTEGATNGFTLWNHNTMYLDCTVFPLSGEMPSVVSESTGTIEAPYKWVNPPMVVGVEYCTTELFKEKPVYRKIVAYKLPSTTNTDFSVPHGISNYDTLVRQTASVGAGIPLPYTHNGNTTSVKELDATNIKVSNTGQSWDSSYTWNFYLYYTKTTD